MASCRNITLIGMPGSGKTTIGKELAKQLHWTFVDTDQCIEEGEGKRLEEIIDDVGFDAFLQIEARYVQQVVGKNQVISTGGSVIYVAAAMQHLKSISKIIYLNVSLNELENRLGDLKARGVVIAPGRTVADLWKERHPLYDAYADLNVVSSMEEIEKTTRKVLSLLDLGKKLNS